MKPRGRGEVYLYSFFNLGATWGWAVNTTPRPLYPQERDSVLIVQGARWALEPVWTARNISSSPGFDPLTIQPVASRYTD